MALTDIDYAARAREAGLNVYTIAKGDREGNIRSLEVVPANPTHNCYSVAKAFTVLALGLLYDRGLLDTEMRVCDILGEFLPKDADPKWRQITLDNLMLHRVGFGRGLLDIDAEDAALWRTHDYIDIVFSEPLPNPRGVERQYTDASYYLLSRVVEKLSGVTLTDLLRPVLMGTMNFSEYAWSVCPLGHTIGATGLYIRTADMVKLGILWLRGGDYAGERVISRKWVDLVLERGYEFKPQGNGWYGKGGMRGQMLVFHPERGIAVAWHSFQHGMKLDYIIKE